MKPESLVNLGNRPGKVDKGAFLAENAPEVTMANRINSLFTLEDTLSAYAVGDSGLVLLSEDGGARWRRLPVPTNHNLYTVHFPGQATIGFSCGDSGTMLKTEDSGRSWRGLITGVRDDLRAVKFPIGPNVGFVAGDSGTILRTADAGATWQRLRTATDHKLMDMNFPSDELTGYAVGPSGAILKTTTGGSVWFSQTGNIQGLMPDTPITAVHFPAGDTGSGSLQPAAATSSSPRTAAKRGGR